MKIQLNTDNNIEGTVAMEAWVNGMIEQHLGRFSSHLTRIEVFFSDSNNDKAGRNDKRCALEARMEKADPIGASHDEDTLEKALRGACSKLKSKLETRVEKRRGY